MFAGAAREAVFSNPEVIRRVSATFVLVALKAALVNNPPPGEEGRLYAEIGRSKPAPQGICVANMAGKVLDWALMFDDDRSVLAFLDQSRARFGDFPDARRPVPAGRYMKFPSTPLPDVPDDGSAPPIPAHHAAGQPCPATPPVPAGTLYARVYGRAFGPDGRPVADTIRQEHYVEDRFDVPVDLQERLSKALASAGAARFRLPDELAQLAVSHAFLGQIDVNPLGSPAGGRGNLKQCEFWGQRHGAPGKGPAWIRIDGTSDVAGDEELTRQPGQNDGRLWRHEVRLAWSGFAEVRGSRVNGLLLLARGKEKLRWGNAFMPAGRDVARLPAGHPIDLDGDVRYGILAEPAPPAEVGAASDGAQDAGSRPPDSAPPLAEILGPQFLVFLPAVMDDLKVSDPQRKMLQQMRMGATEGLQQFMQAIQGLPPPDREAKLKEFREGADRQVSTVLSQLLQPEQQKRLRQIILQHAGLFALAGPDVADELGLTGDQKMRVGTVIEETQKRFQGLAQKAMASGKPEEVAKEGPKIRREQEAKIDALLTPAQRERWKAMTGKPLPLPSGGP